ncbi:hypothetical protein PIROE2DRAFT_19078 [Piromyces sp. E2]|nr:hypothetical protein PIROE2DRAFT_19078 [Piromyces sp. E2]|eukprot:OUM56344.1 hypothetical protein PIROE2DRAFT_19078 [Piromyces sp. E2]
MSGIVLTSWGGYGYCDSGSGSGSGKQVRKLNIREERVVGRKSFCINNPYNNI